MLSMTEKEYNTTEAAHELKIGIEAVRKRIKDGRIKARKEGNEYRISESALEEYKRKTERN